MRLPALKNIGHCGFTDKGYRTGGVAFLCFAEYREITDGIAASRNTGKLWFAALRNTGKLRFAASRNTGEKRFAASRNRYREVRFAASRNTGEHGSLQNKGESRFLVLKNTLNFMAY